ncbi:hypothetical protein [Thermococcus piezophilus]|nr:hypothetical protein [Thermococcus piezophilus]
MIERFDLELVLDIENGTLHGKAVEALAGKSDTFLLNRGLW